MTRFATLTLDTERPSRMAILHPATGQPMVDEAGREAYIDLLSTTSSAAQKARSAIQERRIQRNVRRVSLAEAESESFHVLAACTTGWHLVGLDGKALEVPCTPEAAHELYTTPGLRFIADQATLHAGDAGNFLPGSSTN